jgi:pimeloyl-ACP methyl ester carboxylesterase
MVAIRAARERPERFIKLMTVNTPLYGQILASHVKSGGFAKLLGRGNASNVWARLLRQIPIADPDVQQEIYEDTDNLSEEVVASIQESLLDTDLRPSLEKLEVPLLATYSERDALVNPDHANFLHELTERPIQVLRLPRANHFPFLEQSNVFSRLLLDFLRSQGTPVEIKEEWRRRVSQLDYL